MFASSWAFDDQNGFTDNALWDVPAFLGASTTGCPLGKSIKAKVPSCSSFADVMDLRDPEAPEELCWSTAAAMASVRWAHDLHERKIKFQRTAQRYPFDPLAKRASSKRKCLNAWPWISSNGSNFMKPLHMFLTSSHDNLTATWKTALMISLLLFSSVETVFDRNHTGPVGQTHQTFLASEVPLLCGQRDNAGAKGSPTTLPSDYLSCHRS